ncbi:MAG: hypothetical protein A2679_03785 [Candidatus Sungbacteria bacterium RIFCSPHIGHO2_01_FULL_54_26]|nr:MAG: hypothetical protein A2679_03785 [Candidatus Sungbacteria bacterium RIFCSPHIGHO2_01_FULL_54_26]
MVMGDYTIVYLYFGFIVLVAAVGGIFFMRLVLRRKGLISRSLNLALLAVRLPPVLQEGNAEMTQAVMRERISHMEQLYANLHDIRDAGFRSFFYGPAMFALELTVPHIGEELIFYIAVPRRLSAAVEKAVQGIFSDASVERAKDYNIFNPTGSTAAASLTLSRSRFYPIRTYQKLETDPMRELTNVFTKLAGTGEGAALQIIARPARIKWQMRIKEHAKTRFEGKRPKDRLEKTVDAITQLIASPTGPAVGQSPSGSPVPMVRLTPSEEEMVRALENKASKSLFETNIRLVASAGTRERAGAILQGLQLAFAQFTDPNSNSFYVRQATGASLKALTLDFSFRMFDERAMMVLGSEELTSVFHFPSVPMTTPNVKSVKAREAPPPPNLPAEGILLGYNVFRGETREIRMHDEDRRRHLYVIGQTGTGKTTFIQNLAVQDIKDGKGMCFIDPHGDTVERLLGLVPRHRVQDVVYFNPGDIDRPMGLNMLEYDPRFPEQKSLVVDDLIGIFNKLFNMSVAGGPIFEQYFRNAALLVMEDPASGNTLYEVERVLAEKPFRDLKLSRSKNIVVNNFWTQIAEKAGGEASLKDMVPYIASKFDGFISHDVMRPIILQEKSAFNFREVMDSGKLLFVNLSKGRLGELNSSLIGLILVGKLSLAALSRTDMAEEKRKDFYLYIDEFQNVTTDSIATILSEARKYRLDMVIAHQFIGQLKDEIKKAVFGNVGSQAAFRIGSEDAEFMAKQYAPVFGAQDMLNVDNYNAYLKLLINGATVSPFSMKTYVPERGDAEMAAVVKEISRVKYGRPRAEIEAEIAARHTEKVGTTTNV